MTRIGAIGGGPSPARRGVRPAGGFALPPGAEPAEARSAGAATAVSALLALQEQPPRAAPDRALARAEAVLDELRGLQLDLLRGRPDPGRLARLAALAESGAAPADPALREALSQVALRARVELARRRPGADTVS
jgi:hypothetical protein